MSSSTKHLTDIGSSKCQEVYYKELQRNRTIHNINYCVRWGQYLVASIIAAITSLGNDNDGGMMLFFED